MPSRNNVPAGPGTRRPVGPLQAITPGPVHAITPKAGNYETTVEAARHRQEGDYFVFYADASQTRKVLTVKASIVETIDTDPEN